MMLPYHKIVSSILAVWLVCIVSALDLYAQHSSHFHTGVTFTQKSLDRWGDAQALADGNMLLNNSTVFVNQHLMGFGTLSPEEIPDEYDFGSLMNRIAQDVGVGSGTQAIVLTACCAPDWMKGGAVGETDWERLEVAPSLEFYDDYAELVVETVTRPEFATIRYIQVWNELKGFWNRGANRWNHEGYTELYNKIWYAVKEVRPDIEIGGPYAVMNSFGERRWESSDIGGVWGTLDKRDIEAVEYWFKHKAGADFITLDASITNRDNVYPVDEFESTEKFGDVVNWIRGLDPTEYPGAGSLPIWWAEWYTMPRDEEAGPAKRNALMATALSKMIKAGVQTALVWGPQGDANGYMFPLGLFSDTQIAGGGQSTLFYQTHRNLHDYFSEGTALVDLSSDNANVEILASEQKAMLINKTNGSQSLTIRGATFALQPYEVRLIDMPGQSSCGLLTNGSFADGVNGWNHWGFAGKIHQNRGFLFSGMDPSALPWNGILAQGNLPLESGHQYELRFVISADALRPIKVKVGLGQAPWTNFSYHTIWAGPNPATQVIRFRMDQTTAGRLEFQVGGHATPLGIEYVQLRDLADPCSN